MLVSNIFLGEQKISDSMDWLALQLIQWTFFKILDQKLATQENKKIQRELSLPNIWPKLIIHKKQTGKFWILNFPPIFLYLYVCYIFILSFYFNIIEFWTHTWAHNFHNSNEYFVFVWTWIIYEYFYTYSCQLSIIQLH